MVLVLRLFKEFTLRSVNRVKLDQDEGRVPLKPPPLTSRLMSFERHDKISRGPFSLVLDEMYK